jgi:hypothetical protein
MKYLLAAISLTLCAVAQAASTASLKGDTIHLFDIAYLAGNFCSAPGTDFYISDDDGATLTMSVTSQGNVKFPVPTSCAAGYAQQGASYQAVKSELVNERHTAQSWVTGVLAVPFKFHLSGKAMTPGGTFAPYVGYQTSFFNSFTVTPIAAGGLTLVSTQPLGSKSSETATGFSLASGLIGTVGQSGMQFGVIFGWDWVGSAANYQYEGKPWAALEIGYSFGQ